jgi:predicted ATP-dependent endonuclease of OLD family
MLIGLALRNYKTYQNINFIPVVSQLDTSFTAYVGANGIGKSSILEALDSYFNDRPWNINRAWHKSSKKDVIPFIAPLLLINKEDPLFDFNDNEKKFLDALSDILWNRDAHHSWNDFIAYVKKIKESVCKENKKIEDYWLLMIPISRNANGSIDVDFFNTAKDIHQGLENTAKDIDQGLEEGIEKSDSKFDFDSNSKSKSVLKKLKEKVHYIYLPVEADEKELTQLTTVGIQKLIKTDLPTKIKKLLDEKKFDKQSILDLVNRDIASFMDSIKENLSDGYTYSAGKGKPSKLTSSKLVDTIIEKSLLSNPIRYEKKLKNGEDTSLEFEQMSAGEKRKALIEVYSSLLAMPVDQESQSNSKIIIGIDEPEASLHMSACYSQFEKLFQMSKDAQILLTTHWYGFLPVIQKGQVHFLSKKDTAEEGTKFKSVMAFHTHSLESFAESIRQINGKEVFEYSLKSYTDLRQSILCSLLEEEGKYYNWVICEGTSDKIYLDTFFEAMFPKNNVKVLPVGGIDNVLKKMYTPLCYEIKLNKDHPDLKGKVFCLVDTDENASSTSENSPQAFQSKNIFMKKIFVTSDQNSDAIVKLEDIFKPLNGVTVIEDALNPQVFIKTIEAMDEFKDFVPKFKDKDNDLNKDAQASRHAFNLRPADYKLFKDILFDKTNDSIKVKFAKKYCEIAKECTDTPWPDWMNQIAGANFLNLNSSSKLKEPSPV